MRPPLSASKTLPLLRPTSTHSLSLNPSHGQPPLGFPPPWISLFQTWRANVAFWDRLLSLSVVFAGPAHAVACASAPSLWPSDNPWSLHAPVCLCHHPGVSATVSVLPSACVLCHDCHPCHSSPAPFPRGPCPGWAALLVRSLPSLWGRLKLMAASTEHLLHLSRGPPSCLLLPRSSAAQVRMHHGKEPESLAPWCRVQIPAPPLVRPRTSHALAPCLCLLTHSEAGAEDGPALSTPCPRQHEAIPGRVCAPFGTQLTPLQPLYLLVRFAHQPLLAPWSPNGSGRVRGRVSSQPLRCLLCFILHSVVCSADPSRAPPLRRSPSGGKDGHKPPSTRQLSLRSFLLHFRF